MTFIRLTHTDGSTTRVNPAFITRYHEGNGNTLVFLNEPGEPGEVPYICVTETPDQIDAALEGVQ